MHTVNIAYPSSLTYKNYMIQHGIIQDLYTMSLRGQMPIYVREFLRKRSLKIKISTVYSDSQEDGVPQGGILSVLLFAIKINCIYKQIPQEAKFHTSVYVDDLQLSYRYSDLLITKEKLQECLNRITEWTNKNEFHFSSKKKTKAMHFTQLPGLHPSLELYMYKKEIKY